VVFFSLIVPCGERHFPYRPPHRGVPTGNL